MQPLKIVSYNVIGLLSPIKRSKILTKLKRDRTEIAFLQETHLSQVEHAKLTKMGFKYQFSSSYSTGHRRGVSILISSKITFEILFEKKDKEGRYVLLRGKIGGSLVTLLNVYVPPNSEWKFFKTFFDLIISEVQVFLICGGDFNLRLDPNLDSSNPKIYQPKLLVKKFKAAMRDIGLIDLWRQLNPAVKDFTYYSNPHAAFSRIDYFYIFSKDLHKIDNCGIGSMDLSDHSPIYVKLDMDIDCRSTLWRLNTFVLGQMKEQVKLDINEYMDLNDNGEITPIILWAACKAVIRGKLIAYSSNLKKSRQKRLLELESELKQLEKDYKETRDHTLKEPITKKKNEIDNVYSNDIQKRLIFTKQTYYEGGAKATKLLVYKFKETTSREFDL